MSDLNARLLAQRIDTVLDILVAGDYHSAIHNLEILKAELQALSRRAREGLRAIESAVGNLIHSCPQHALRPAGRRTSNCDVAMNARQQSILQMVIDKGRMSVADLAG